jgi:hypothetical protein
MEIKYLCTYWGQAPLSAEAFVTKTKEAAYDGLEVDLPDDPYFINKLIKQRELLEAQNIPMPIVAQMVLASQKETVAENISRMLKRLIELSALHPIFINSQTGKDFFSFDDNCRIIEAAMNFSVKSGISVVHETHRGKFSFHLATLLPYLKHFPEMQLAADFSLLEDQLALIEELIPHVGHVHARVGFSQSAQVNNPMAPEWESALKTHVEWWQKIVDHHLKKNAKSLTITPEFGPAPYMPAMPYTQQPLGNQWNININMMQFLKDHLKTK